MHHKHHSDDGIILTMTPTVIVIAHGIHLVIPVLITSDALTKVALLSSCSSHTLILVTVGALCLKR